MGGLLLFPPSSMALKNTSPGDVQPMAPRIKGLNPMDTSNSKCGDEDATNQSIDES